MNEKKKLIIFLFNKTLNKYYRIYKRYFYILYIEGVSFSHFPKKMKRNSNTSLYFGQKSSFNRI